MSSYTEPLERHYYGKVNGRRKWHIDKAFRYYVGGLSGSVWVDIPYGYLSDGASVPWPFKLILSPWGKYGQAAVVHDWLCENLYVIDEAGVRYEISRKEADEIFLEAMEALRVSPIVRNIMYASVRAWAYLKLLKNLG